MMTVDEALEYAQNALERAFENWLESEQPSGDCESVHRQWDESYAHQELLDELQPVMALTWEVRRLREELAEWKGAAGVAGFTVGVLREENERLHSAPPQQSPGPDCRTCINRGHINGLSQETYCDSCMWYGAYWKKNNYNPLPEPAP
jgi:hypothetical protein